MFKFFKNIIFIICLLFVFTILNVEAKNKNEVTLSKCVDGDTAWFIIKNEKVKVRFLAIDTPESTNKIEPYGKEASSFTCNLLTNANKIEIEYDVDKTDKYNRTLAWIFVDDKLLQKLLVDEGLAKVAYLYNDYKYTSVLKESEKSAKQKKLNIWSDYDNKNNILIFIIIVICIVVLCIFNKSFRIKTNKKIKKRINKEINNLLK